MPAPGAHDDVQLRDATIDDAEVLFGWANDPATRAASLSTQMIAWDEHVAWLDRVLARTDAALYVASLGDELVGQARFEATQDGRLRISVVVAPRARGRGLATSLITAAVARCLGPGSSTPILAEIRTTNERSRRAFERAGFRRVRTVLAHDGESVDQYVRVGDAQPSPTSF